MAEESDISSDRNRIYRIIHRRLIVLKMNQIKERFPYNILYFPTYRLVEEDLYRREDTKSRLPGHARQLIQFGMREVREKWDNVTDEIRRSSVQWFSKISGNMLNELTDGIQPEAIEYDSIENHKEALRIVLDRGGENIFPDKKKCILKLVDSGDIRNDEYKPLAYFLSKLIKIYERQQV